MSTQIAKRAKDCTEIWQLLYTKVLLVHHIEKHNIISTTCRLVDFMVNTKNSSLDHTFFLFYSLC